MSENITILEGGKAESFGQIAKLKTSNGSGNDLWVPKAYVETKHLSVKKNGLYYTNQYTPTASEKKSGKAYDIYGWDTITVSVKKKVTGKKRKGSKDVPTSVEVDDNGNLIESEMMPTRIEIKTLPEQTAYFDGESIYLDGIVVKAYTEDDQEWGTVPLNELSPKPSKAEYTETELGFTADADWLVDAKGTYLGYVARYASGAHHADFYKTYDGKAIAAFSVPSVASRWCGPYLVALDKKSVTFSPNSNSYSTYEKDGYTWHVCYNYHLVTNIYDSGSINHELPRLADRNEFVDLMIELSNAQPYGGEKGKQTIEVRWDRGDGTILTDSFNITVNPAP